MSFATCLGMSTPEQRERLLAAARRSAAVTSSFLPENYGKWTFLQISPSKWALELDRRALPKGPTIALELVRVGHETVAWWMLRGSRPVRWDQPVGQA
jgi:hypothetical protein